MVDQLQLEDFSSRVGETFFLETDSGDTVEIELIEASGVGGNQLKRPPFSIVFRVPDGVVTEQRIFKIGHGEMKEMALFLVPLGPGKEGMQCEAVFT